MKSGLMERVEIKLKEADKFLGSNQWFAGDRVSLSLLCSFITVSRIYI